MQHRFSSTHLLIALAATSCAGALHADQDHTFLEKDGIVLFDAEDSDPVEGWELRTELPGYRGDGYLEWRGPNHFSSASAGNGNVTYHFRITTAGNYQLRLRNHIAEGDSNTESNDSWIRLATGVDIPDEQPLNGWTKVYANTAGQWTWASRTLDHTGLPVRQYLAEGDHTIEISGRSRGHAIDMISLYRYEDVNYSTSSVNRWKLSEVVTDGKPVVVPGEYPESNDNDDEPPLVVERDNLDIADSSWIDINDNECVDNTLALPAIDSSVFTATDSDSGYTSGLELTVSPVDSTALLLFDLSNVPPYSTSTLEYSTTDAVSHGSLQYALASHSQWSSLSELEQNDIHPDFMLLLGSASGGWQPDARHQSTLISAVPTGSMSTVMISSAADGGSIDIFSHLQEDLAPRLLLSGNDAFCSNLQANIDAANAPEEPVVEVTEEPEEEVVEKDEPEESDEEIDSVDVENHTNDTTSRSRGGAFSLTEFIILLLSSSVALMRRQAAGWLRS